MGFSSQEYWSGFPFPSLKSYSQATLTQGSPTLCAVTGFMYLCTFKINFNRMFIECLRWLSSIPGRTSVPSKLAFQWERCSLFREQEELWWWQKSCASSTIHHYSHCYFTDGETEAQSRSVTCLKSLSTSAALSKQGPRVPWWFLLISTARKINCFLGEWVSGGTSLLYFFLCIF